MDEKYHGFKRLSLNDNDLGKFYNQEYPIEMLENEYLLLENENGELIDKLCYQNGKFRQLQAFRIKSRWDGEIKPRNEYQSLAIDMLHDESIGVKVLTGVYGSAKTFLMLHAALAEVEKGSYEKVIFVRNGLSPLGVPDIGALPGTALEKTIVWGNCIADHVGGEDGLGMLINNHMLEIIPLNFIRGRDLKHSIIFSDESENLTVKLIQLLIGRVSEGSQLWLAGDYRQTDLAKKYPEGLSKMIEKLKGQRLFGIVDMPKTERSAIAELSNLLDE